MIVKLNDTLILKKSHPCGGNEFVVERVGADFKLKCTTCNRYVWIDRIEINKRIKKRIMQGVYTMDKFYSKVANDAKASEIRELLKLTQYPDFISFAGGLPAAELFPIQEIKESCCNMLDTIGKEALQYSTTEGYMPLRNQIADFMQAEGNFGVNPEDVIITSGSQQGLDMVGKVLLDPGDTVIVESPSYLGAINAFKQYYCNFVEVETDENGMKMNDLENKLKASKNVKLIYVVPDFQNPSGKCWSLERRKQLIALANKYDVLIVDDCPYREVRFEGDAVPTVTSLDKENRVIHLGTFSKILTPGLRTAWMYSKSSEIINKMVLVKQSMDLQSNSFTQRLISIYLDNNNIFDHINKLIKVYKSRRDTMINAIDKYFPQGVTFVKPEGGLFLFLELPENIKSREFAEKLIEKKVGIVPGDSFYPDGKVKNTARLNYSCMNEEKIEQGIKIMGEVLKDMLK